MTFLKSVGNLLFGGLGAILKPFGSGSKKARPVLQPREARRDEDVAGVAAADELARRRGAAADMITGTRGAEAAASSIGRLVVGS